MQIARTLFTFASPIHVEFTILSQLLKSSCYWVGGGVDCYFLLVSTPDTMTLNPHPHHQPGVYCNEIWSKHKNSAKTISYQQSSRNK